MKIRVALAVLLLSQTLALSAQQPIPEPSTWVISASDDLILQWLHSPDPRLQAWGAHFVLTQNRTQLLPEVESLAQHSIASTHQTNLTRPILAELDTILQLNGSLPTDTLEILTVASNQRLILLSRLTPQEANPLLLHLYQAGEAANNNSLETRITAQMLAQHPPAGFAATLLKAIKINAQINVHDPDTGFGFGSSSCGSGVATGASPSNWPPIGSYQFHDPPRDNKPIPSEWMLFLPAPDPVYLERRVNLAYLGDQRSGLFGLTDAIRSHIVGTLLGGSPLAPFPEVQPTLDITFHDRDSYYTAVTQFIEGHQQNFAQVISKLTQRGLMTEEERQAAKLRITLTLHDFRRPPAPDLPNITY